MARKSAKHRGYAKKEQDGYDSEEFNVSVASTETDQKSDTSDHHPQEEKLTPSFELEQEIEELLEKRFFMYRRHDELLMANFFQLHFVNRTTARVHALEKITKLLMQYIPSESFLDKYVRILYLQKMLYNIEYLFLFLY